MSKRSKGLMIMASLSILVLYFFPLWKITIDAPQYPEGLGLYISIDQVSGEHKNDLNTINELNHYIGMKVITPEAIPELKIMPWIVGALMAFGLLVAWVGKRFLLYSWVVVFLLVGLVGLADFYKWEYDYGHDLNPRAAIKVPGMNYQPPLIGSKQLLNIHTVSYPYIGGVMAGISLLIGLWVCFRERKRSKKKDEAL